MHSLHAFVRLSRLKFLAGGVLGVALGTAAAAWFASQRTSAVEWLAAQAAVTAFQLMTHYANDYFDRAADTASARTPFSGGSGVLVEGGLPAQAALGAALACALAGLAAAFCFAFAGRVLCCALLLAIGAIAWAYSAPPVRLLARGLGEMATALVVGSLVPLAAAAAQGANLNLGLLAITLPGASATFAMMLCVHVPDLAADAASHTRNLLVRRGRSAVAPLVRRALIGTFASAALAVALGAPLAFGLLLALAVPHAMLLAGRLPGVARLKRPDRAAEGALAGRGVAFSFAVVLDGALGLAAALPWRI